MEINGNSNKELRQILEIGYKDIMGQILANAELSLPFIKGDNSENEKKFSLLRSKTLRLINDHIRGLDSIFNNFVAFKLYENIIVENNRIQVDIINFKNQFKIEGKGKENGNAN